MSWEDAEVRFTMGGARQQGMQAQAGGRPPLKAVANLCGRRQGSSEAARVTI